MCLHFLYVLFSRYVNELCRVAYRYMGKHVYICIGFLDLREPTLDTEHSGCSSCILDLRDYLGKLYNKVENELCH